MDRVSVTRDMEELEEEKEYSDRERQDTPLFPPHKAAQREVVVVKNGKIYHWKQKCPIPK